MDRASGATGSGGPCWRLCRTSWGHRGTATAGSRARWRLSSAERAPRAGGAGGRRRGLASFAGQRFQPCSPLPCASGAGRGVPTRSLLARETLLWAQGSVTYRWVQGQAVLAVPPLLLPRGRRLSRGLLPRAAGKLQSPKGNTKCLVFLEVLYSHIQSQPSHQSPDVQYWRELFSSREVSSLLTWNIS